ncbi:MULTISPECIES: hypothetical protein [unclassified Microbacterium]|uniref:hypothetical protein n=1 Tax=unclassified Microbacterium TaxID=2609290 RepID=UPI0024684556|nr:MULTISPECIES: hypothetical protein [unclassified Microbacterium]MDH5132857.1 hypothetical protein [Microbacterium sp. RD10]MDH5136426.1 hypothetical protein [Microbacterium sp. RD11]MDH5145108.1 hypothetical protein [Microbacterium sp. RD12]MDH5154815.1 hypothetical protein [Microbacterium sp. RD06]MDH5164923.1 hypothetical protein [Microbacterium sp. RD02]
MTMTLETDALARVAAQVARNDVRLESYYSGATDSARRGLAAREKFLREKALQRHG